MTLNSLGLKTATAGFLFGLLSACGNSTSASSNPILGRWMNSGFAGPGTVEFTPAEMVRPSFKERFPVTYDVKKNVVAVKFKNEEQNITCEVAGDAMTCKNIVGIAFEMKRMK